MMLTRSVCSRSSASSASHAPGRPADTELPAAEELWYCLLIGACVEEAQGTAFPAPAAVCSTAIRMITAIKTKQLLNRKKKKGR